MPSDTSLFFLKDATIVRLGGAVAFRDFTWSIRAGETWAIVGPVGSGKTTLAETILGRHRLRTGSMGWPFFERPRADDRPTTWPADAIELVAFKEDSWLFSYGRHYYQQRFNFIEPRDDLTLASFLRSGSAATEAAIHAVAGRLGIDPLLPQSFINLSNGQVRRARIARALLSHPEMLILDDPFLGLDAAGRAEVANLVGDLIHQGIHVLLVTRPEVLPDWVTHVVELDQGSIRWQGPRSESGRMRAEDGRKNEMVSPPPSACVPPSSAAPLVELKNVTVSYGGRPVLHDVSWTVRAGERWAVLGPNGSGKTTLLSLLCGDHPQAYANDVRIFGRRRGTGESIWDVKRGIGLVSPELHLYFTEPLTAAEAAATGFFDVLARRPTTAAQRAIVHDLFDFFGIRGLAERPFAGLSTGEQRLVLLVRALVKNPPLLILDEPFQGLDGQTIERARTWLDEQLRPEQALIFVTHYPAEIPRTVHHRLCLEEGRVIERV
jgi:molybdate transport system ATP-binding protein